MQSQPSRLLENLVALGAFDAEKRDLTTHLLDHLFLIMLGQRGCHAMRILAERLQDWEIRELRRSVERAMEAEGTGGAPKDRTLFYTELMESLAETAAIWAGARAASGHDAAAGVAFNGDPDAPRAASRGKNDADKGAKAHSRPSDDDTPHGGPNTGHLLLHVLAAGDSVAARALGIYGVMADEVGRRLASLPAAELYISEIRIIRRRELSPGHDDWEPSRHDAPAPEAAPKEHAPHRESALLKYGVDLTQAAARGEIDPVVGRDAEIERMAQILGRRKKNNPILVGEAGVGKSAIVEGLALRIASGEVSKTLKDKSVILLDLAALVAGTKFRGEFEERLKALVDEVGRTPGTILFIDEVHTIVGAGSSHGSMDVANILKPALARGQVQCIGATTLDEYRENIEKDAALERRFQKIVVEPASPEATLEILRHIAPHYEAHHSVSYTDEALRACVALTERYIAERHFPDKAIDALDEAGSRARGGTALVPVEITARAIEQTITTMTGIPVERVSLDAGARLCRLERELSEVVVGQQAAVAKVSRALVRSRSGLKDPSKPIGVFMFVGPTGVGKTLLATELSRRMHDRPDALVRIDMSEYSERHNVSRLIGSPPGYVGYGEGGQLTEAVRRQPYSVVLLDEIEKAHPDLFNLMLQMLDDGHLTDGLGRRVDFRNTIIIMTSNVGSREFAAKAPVVGYSTPSVAAASGVVSREAEYRRALEATFAPEFINRVDDIVVFNRLEAEEIGRVVDLELASLARRAAPLGYTLEVTEQARIELAVMGFEPDYGVRSLKRTILEMVEEPLAAMIVSGEVHPGDRIEIGYTDGEFTLTVGDVRPAHADAARKAAEICGAGEMICGAGAESDACAAGAA